MCGIIGIYSKNILKDNHLDLFEKLMNESSIRGLHSFGVSYLDGNKLKTLKSNILDSNLFISNIKNVKAKKVIFHNRYSTSGDYSIMDNNQPIFIDNMALVMNGVLSMKTKDEFEKDFNVKCNVDNDTEIFLQLIKKGKTVKDILLENPNCSFAGIFLSDKEMFAIRNNKRPLYYFNYDGALFIVSTADIAKRGGFNGDIKPIKTFEELYCNG